MSDENQDENKNEIISIFQFLSLFFYYYSVTVFIEFFVSIPVSFLTIIIQLLYRCRF